MTGNGKHNTTYIFMVIFLGDGKHGIVLPTKSLWFSYVYKSKLPALPRRQDRKNQVAAALRLLEHLGRPMGPMGMLDFCPLVNIQKTMDNHHVQWVNQL